MRSATKFLVGSVLGAANTVNAYKPFARHGPVSVPSFFAGWLTSELPLHTVAWQSVATAAFSLRRGVGSPATKAGIAINVGSWVALAALYRQAAASYTTLDVALVDGLGPPDEEPTDPRTPITTRQVALPFASSRKLLGVELDTSYGDGGKRNLLDVWHRDDLPADGSAPVLLQVHGGAWTIGNKEQQGGPLMTEMCARGWVCVAINYRLSPKATWPDHIVDVKRAIAWIKENIDRFGGNPDYIAISGGSAGGHLSSLAALSPNAAIFQPGFEDVDTSVQAAVPMYGVYDFCNRDGTGRDDMSGMLEKTVLKVAIADDPERWDQASTVSWINSDAVPFMIVHGTNDALVPVEQARSFAAALRQVSKSPVVYAELERTQHAFDVFGSVRALHTVRAVGDFLDRTHAMAQDDQHQGATTSNNVN